MLLRSTTASSGMSPQFVLEAPQILSVWWKHLSGNRIYVTQKPKLIATNTDKKKFAQVYVANIYQPILTKKANKTYNMFPAKNHGGPPVCLIGNLGLGKKFALRSTNQGRDTVVGIHLWKKNIVELMSKCANEWSSSSGMY